ncbi:uncharacterized protein [Linepithema humile]|uniref:uncharacterized protein n=1 Tax=Linepithema humile TaxID=83485 RepID=UPI00351DBFF2
MDEKKKDEFTVEMEVKMLMPLIWDSPAICKIQDLKEAQYEEVLRLIKHHYFKEEPMCKAAFLLQNQESVNAYLNLIRTWIKDTTSLVALSLASGRVIGIAVTRISSDSDKTDTYNRVLVRVLSYKNKCFKLYKFAISLREDFLNVMLMWHYNTIDGVFTSGLSQSLAPKLGFRFVSEIRYSQWVVDNQIVFDDPGNGNYSAAFMRMQIPFQKSISKL